MTLYTISYVLEGCGTQRALNVLASSFESAMKMFHKAHPDSLITHVTVGEKTIMYEEANEITESDST